MVSLITEKFSIPSNISYNPAYINTSPVKKQSLKEITPAKKDKTLISLSLAAVGGILLYLGLKSPGKAQIFDKNIRNQVFKMEAEINAYVLYIKGIIDSSFEPISKYIKEYTAHNFINPLGFFANAKMLKEPISVARAQDLAFEAINRNNLEVSKAGASDMDTFAIKIEKIKKETAAKIDQKKEKIKLKIEDYIHLPNLNKDDSSDLTEAAENRLITMASSLSEQMNDIKDKKLNAIVKRQYAKMAEAITTARNLKYETKENVINNVYNHIRELLKLPENFVPSYYKIPTLENFERLTTEELKRTSLPKALKEPHIKNIYLTAIETKDFNNLTNEDLNEIFYKASYDNNLQDLGFLIDRLRIRQVVAKSQNNTIEENTYRVIITKLEYLLNKLHEFGESELLKKCRLNFDNMELEQRRARLYDISTVSRRLGFTTLQEMDSYFAKYNEDYKLLNIREYINIFKNNPDLYFF